LHPYQRKFVHTEEQSLEQSTVNLKKLEKITSGGYHYLAFVKRSMFELLAKVGCLTTQTFSPTNIISRTLVAALHLHGDYSMFGHTVMFCGFVFWYNFFGRTVSALIQVLNIRKRTKVYT
jgi:hypothetical protein